MTFKDMVERVYRGQDPGGVIWQPRLEYWYDVNDKRGTLPEPLNGASLMDVYDYCHASVRYGRDYIHTRYDDTVNIEEEQLGDQRVRKNWVTPVGTVTEVIHVDKWESSRYTHEYKVKTPEDLLVLKHIYEHEEWYWDDGEWEGDLDIIGDRGIPSGWFRRSPFVHGVLYTMGMERMVYMLYDHPEAIQMYMEFAGKADDAMYDLVCKAPIRILSYPENLDCNLFPPRFWDTYLVPYHRKRMKQLHDSGKWIHLHADGAVKGLMDRLMDVPWDGIEALTPVPMGDVTIPEMLRCCKVNDRGREAGIVYPNDQAIMLDGIPAVYFMHQHTEEELYSCTDELVKTFYPRLILGISDEIPPDGDIERVRAVGKYVQTLM